MQSGLMPTQPRQQVTISSCSVSSSSELPLLLQGAGLSGFGFPFCLLRVGFSGVVHQQNVFQSLKASRSVREDVECKPRCVNFRRVSDPRTGLLPAFRVTGTADDKPGSTSERWRQTWEHQRHVWEHLQSQWSSLGKTTSSLGMLLVRLEIIATVFSLYSHLCIYVSIYLYSYPSTHSISGLPAGSAWEQFEVGLKMTIEWTQRYTPSPWSSEFGDALGGDHRASFEAVIARG